MRLLFWFLLSFLIVVMLLQLLLPLQVMLVVLVFFSYITLTLLPRTLILTHLGGARNLVPTWPQMCSLSH